MSSFYVTTPIYYVNDLPHIGHIYTSVVADTVARYHRLAGDRTFFLTGTDEHGQKIERAAKERGVEPLELADRVVERYHELYRQLAISHDDFIRTTEPRHEVAVREIIARIAAAGDFYVGTHEGWYCAGCETFYTEKELLAGDRCPIHETAVEWRSEENVFFRLSRYQDRLLELYRERPEIVQPATRLNEMRAFVEAGLKDLSVSRSTLEWGIAFPGHPGHTVYVWLDALTNYISALGFGRGDGGGESYRAFWGDPDAVRLHIVGKDILRFHAVYWPAFLLSAGLPLPTTVWAHGWWTADEKKISKSVGNVIRPDELIGRFGSDGLRYFLLREMVFGQDAAFSDEAFVDRWNGDLANGLGNTVSRVVTLSRRAFGGTTPPGACSDSPLVAAAETAVADYRRAMEELAFHRALESLWRLLAETNQYLVEREPWKLIKSEGASQRLSHILWNGLEAARIVASGLLPVMPEIVPRVLAALGSPEPPAGLAALAWGGTPTGAPLPEPEPLFPRIDKEAYLGAAAPGGAAPREGGTDVQKGSDRAMISIEKFFETELKVATVVAAERVPKSSKLLRLEVDLGSERRQVVAGIAKEYEPGALVGQQVVVVANLEAAKLMGIESQGMVLAASEDGAPVLLHPDRPVPPGTQVR